MKTWSTCLALVLGLAAMANATTIDGDFVIVFDGDTAVFGDNFDAALASPPWFVISGAPTSGGGFLNAQGGDQVFAPLQVSGQADTSAIFQTNLTDFPAGSSVTLFLFGLDAGDFLGLTVTPDSAFVVNEGGVLGGLPLDPGPSAQLILSYDVTGNASASVNGTPIFFGGDAFTPASGVSILVVPEPAAVIGLLAGFVLLRSRR